MDTGLPKSTKVQDLVTNQIILQSVVSKFVTQELPVTSTFVSTSEDGAGPSWGLIIPIILIGVFLVSVGLCLWWHRWWNRKRARRIQLEHGTSFHRSFRGSRNDHTGLDAARDSTRSTTPLRSSSNDNSWNHTSVVKTNNVNVTPLQRTGKYSFYWEKNHWKAYPHATMGSSFPLGTKPLSPINEISSPSSFKLSDMSKTYDANSHLSSSSYQLNRTTSSSAPPSYKQLHKDTKNYTSSQHRLAVPFPVCPNNTPTTDCDTQSNTSYMQNADRKGDGMTNPGSLNASYPSNQKSTDYSGSNTGFSSSNETDRNTSLGTSYRSTYGDQCSCLSQESSVHRSCHISTTEHASTNYSSLPRSIAQFSRKNVLLQDQNNNSMIIPNAHMTFPVVKALNYTLASSVASSDTHAPDSTSILANFGSSSEKPSTAASHSYPQSTGLTNPEHLSKLVDEMSSIRPTEESSSSLRSVSSPSLRISRNTEEAYEFHRSWSIIVEVERESKSSSGTGSRRNSLNRSLNWDNYPLNHDGPMSYTDSPIHINHGYLVQHLRHHRSPVPVLLETQYWV